MLPTDNKARKLIRAFQGFVKYFPDAIAACANLSRVANEQHNPGEPMHWAKEKSKDELDSLMNHLLDIASKGPESRDEDGILDAVKVFWRAGANLQRLADSGVDIINVPEPAFGFNGIRDEDLGDRLNGPTKFDHEGRAPVKLTVEKPGCMYVVQFQNDDMQAHITYTSFEGPFLDLRDAEDHARLNPNNISGHKSVHAVNAPL